MTALGWLIVVGCFVLCEGGGALATWLALRARYERALNYWEQEAYDRGRYDEYLQAGTPVPGYSKVVLHSPGLARHVRPRPTADASRADAAVAVIREQFAIIRGQFGLPEYRALDGPQVTELHHLAGVTGPPLGGPLRAAGHATGASWPPAGPVG